MTEPSDEDQITEEAEASEPLASEPEAVESDVEETEAAEPSVEESEAAKPRWITVSLLAIGTLLFAASFSVIKKLIGIGEITFADGRNPISYCNVLFAGNVIAAVTFTAMFPRDLSPARAGRVGLKQWALIVAVALLEGAIAPTFIFLALMEISVASVLLVESVKIPLVLLIAWLAFGERANRIAVTGAIVATLGIIAMVAVRRLVDPMEDAMMGGIGRGELKVLIASAAFVIATQLRRGLSKNVPIGIYSVTRTVVGCIFFAIIVMIMFGPTHFTDLFDPFLWKWVAVYGVLVVGVGQLVWHKGLGSATSVDLSVAEAATPILGVLFAFVILGEIPSQSEWIGGGIVLIGIFLSLRGKVIEGRTPARQAASFEGI
ncbi:MAG: DMT family transporter [Verrucomicrobiota bacterium]